MSGRLMSTLRRPMLVQARLGHKAFHARAHTALQQRCRLLSAHCFEFFSTFPNFTKLSIARIHMRAASSSVSTNCISTGPLLPQDQQHMTQKACAARAGVPTAILGAAQTRRPGKWAMASTGRAGAFGSRRSCSTDATQASAGMSGSPPRKAAKPSPPGLARGTPAVLVRKQKKKKPSRGEPGFSARVSAHLMGSVHGPSELAALLRVRFGAAAVKLIDKNDEVPEASGQRASVVEDVVCVTAPALGADSPHGTPLATVFFFTGHGSTEDEAATRRGAASHGSDVSTGVGASSAGGIASIGSGGGARVCVAVAWGAASELIEPLLTDLRAAKSNAFISKQHSLERLAVAKEETSFTFGERSVLQGETSEICLDGSQSAPSRSLDQLAFSHALMRHMKLLLVEDEAERIVADMKKTVRQGLGASLMRRLLPTALGGSDFGANTMQRLLLLREFNFDPDLMSTPDWLWEQPHREEMYDAMVAEYEIEDRIEAVNQQLNYAQGTMQSLKEDKHHSHSLFLEYTICFLIAFEIFVEVHALGWLDFGRVTQERGDPTHGAGPVRRHSSSGGKFAARDGT